MRKIALLLIVLFSVVCSAEEFFRLNAKDILEKDTVSFDEYKGKVSLVTNTASECGYTDSHMKAYRQLHNLLSRGGRFNILAFPCNQFGDQEPLTGKKLRQFMTEKYHASYPVFEKTDVYGSNAHPVWKYLNQVSNSPPSWNFWKYLIDHDGNFVQAWGPTTRVEDIFDEIKSAVDKAEELLGPVESTTDDSIKTEETFHSHGEL